MGKDISVYERGEVVAEDDKHIYRNANGLLGGVCCGVAERFDFDVALVRLSVIIFSVLTAGAFMLVYLAAWLILPAKSLYGDTVEVNPASFKSEVYEQVVEGAPTKANNVAASIPPVPPAAASSYYRQAPHISYATMPVSAGASSQAAQDAFASRPIKVGLGIGIGLIVLGALIFWTNFVSVDMGAWASFASPFLLICAGLFIMGRAAKSDVLLVCAGLALVVFLVVGTYYSVSSSQLDFGASLSFSPDTLQEQGEG